MPRPKNDDGYTLTRRNGNSDRPWGQPEEISLRGAGLGHRCSWTVLAEDLALRLERTRADKALAVPIQAEYAMRARGALWFWFRKHCGERAVIVHIRKETDGTTSLIVHRGPKWGCYPVKELEDIK